MSFDADWNKFVCSNSDHIQSVVYDPFLAGSNPVVRALPSRLSIARDGPAAPVFRISPDEPWRVMRTRWRVAGAVSGPVEGGGTPSGYFTGATGVTLFTGDAWGEDYRGDAWIADCGSNLIHHKRLHQEGPIFPPFAPRMNRKQSSFDLLNIGFVQSNLPMPLMAICMSWTCIAK